MNWLCALSSMILFLIVISLAVHVRLGLGHWPTPIYESYRTSAFVLHMTILERVAYFSLYFAGPLWLLSLLVVPFDPPWRGILLSQLAVTILGWLLVVGFLALDPTTFSAWLMD